MKKQFWKVKFFYTDAVQVFRRIPLTDIIDVSSPEVKQKLEDRFKTKVKTSVENVHSYQFGYIHMAADCKGEVPLRAVIDAVNVFAPRKGNSKAAITQLQYATAWYGNAEFDQLQKVMTHSGISTKATPTWLHNNNPFMTPAFSMRTPHSLILELVVKGVIVPSYPIDPHELQVQSSLGIGADYVKSIPAKVDYELLTFLKIKEDDSTHKLAAEAVEKMNKAGVV